MAKQKQIVTRDTIARMLDNPNRKYVETVIGRALLALLEPGRLARFLGHLHLLNLHLPPPGFLPGGA